VPQNLHGRGDGCAKREVEEVKDEIPLLRLDHWDVDRKNYEWDLPVAMAALTQSLLSHLPAFHGLVGGQMSCCCCWRWWLSSLLAGW
jgi:hypothetical protein